MVNIKDLWLVSPASSYKNGLVKHIFYGSLLQKSKSLTWELEQKGDDPYQNIIV